MPAKTESLEDLLDKARRADATGRIGLRDPIAAFGLEAVAAMRPWVDDPKLGAFAVRIIERTATGLARTGAVAALAEARAGASGIIRKDIDDALARLGVAATVSRPSAAPVKGPVEMNRNLYDVLVAAARAGKTMTYSEAGEVVGLSMRNPNHRRVLGQHLGAISEFEVEHGRPMLSALVVQKGSGQKRTGTGFDQLGEELGLKRALDDEATFEGRQLDQVFAYWRSVTEAQKTSKLGAAHRGAPPNAGRIVAGRQPYTRDRRLVGIPPFHVKLPGRWSRSQPRSIAARVTSMPLPSDLDRRSLTDGYPCR
jgi:hypothetical protein